MSGLTIPPDLRFLAGMRYEKAFPIEYQNIQLEDVLPGIFYVTRLGRRRGKGYWAKRSAQDVAETLSTDDLHFPGWDSQVGRDVLEEWVNASVLRYSGRGRTDRLLGVRPLHFLTYRIDLPPRWDWLRFIPEFVCSILTKDPQQPGASAKDDPFALQRPENLFWRAFGANLLPPEDHLGNADGDRLVEEDPIDIESLLAVRVAQILRTPDQLVRGAARGAGGDLPGVDPLCPGRARVFREDFSLYLRAYGDNEIPTRALGDQVLALLGFELLVYSLGHVAASNHLYRTGEWLSDKNDELGRWELDLYVDLTGGRNPVSAQIARASFLRHSSWLMDQIRAMLGFRLLAYHLEGAQDIPTMRDLRRLTGIEFLTRLTDGRLPQGGEAYGSVNAWARTDRNRLRLAQPNGEWPPELQPVAEDPELGPFDSLVELIATADHELRSSMRKYMLSIGRRNQGSGMIAGSPRKDDDRYVLGPLLLEALVHLLVLKPGHPPKAGPLDVSDFVELLKRRYGIWVDEPPPSLDQSYEAHEAARANYEALKETLRQLGLFRAVTDAKGMQRLRPRYVALGDRRDGEERA